MATWLVDHPGAIDGVIARLFETIRFMRAQGMVHFDAHFHNVLTDGERHYLTDFGLALDATFDLSDAERAFLGRHMDYDFGEVLYAVGMQLGMLLMRLDEAEQGRVLSQMGLEGPIWGEALQQIIVRYEEFAALTPVAPELLAALRRYGDVMAFVGEFLHALRADMRKETRLDDEKLRRLLREAGVAL
jgi:hypothetical protein